MTPELNVFYGILTDGDNYQRRTTTTTPETATIVKLVAALIPNTASAECKRALAELYIRLIQTDKSLEALLNRIDPINSYKLQSFREPFGDGNIIPTIVREIRAIGVPDEENSALPFDTIKAALKALLEALNGDS